jgi:hypothetical protein
MKTNYATTATAPSVYVTKNRQRIKQYNNTVYLNNGDEFELEFFNPTTGKVLAKIELDGKSIGSGIVLRPGERVFLERYLNEARKFLFETYKVNGSSEEVKQAIALNGIVSVKFYNEQPPVNIYQHCNSAITYSNPWTTTGSPYNNPTFTTSNSRGIVGAATSASYFSSEVKSTDINDLGFMDMDLERSVEPTSTRRMKSKSMFKSPGVSIFEKDNTEIETGRLEKGSHSNQSFTYDSTKFNYFYTWMTEWKILPLSQKVLTKEDLAVFCTNCGTKRKKESHKFCPNCGEKF